MTRSEDVRFHSQGSALAGTLLLPDGASSDAPGAGHRPGPGLARPARRQALQPVPRGAARRGHGGPRVRLPRLRRFRGRRDATSTRWRQVADWRNAVTYLETRAEIDADAHRRLRHRAAPAAATPSSSPASTSGSRPTVSQVPIADGRDWLHRMRREHEWLEFLERIRRGPRARACTTGAGRARRTRATGSWSRPPERKTTTIKSDVDGRIPAQVELASAEAIFAYRPIDVVDRIAPRAAR